MQVVPNRPLGSYGYAPLLPVAPSRKPSGGGKSFTIDALLAEPQPSSPSRDRLPPSPLLPLPPLQVTAQPHGAPAALPPPYLFQPALLHAPAGYPGYCCWTPYSCQPGTCRGGFYAQAPPMSRMNPFKARSGKSKRLRTSFTSEQLSRLEKEFARQQYMVGSERFLLASALQLTEAQVKVWFQNRRIKWRKQSLEQQQAKLAKLGLAAPPRSPGSQGQDEEEEEEFSDLDVDVSDC